MPLKYQLIKNLLVKESEAYVAQMVENQSKDLSDIVEAMVSQGTTLTKSDIVAVLTAFFERIETLTAQGTSVNTPLIKTRFSIRGNFDGAEAKFDTKMQQVKIHVRPGPQLLRALEQVKVKKVPAMEVLPTIREVKDLVSGSVNKQITPQGVVEIIGSRLKILGTDSHNGIVFVGQDGRSYKVGLLVSNQPSKLMFIAPNMPAGNYALQVITQFSRGNKQGLKEPRTGVFAKHLVVS